jgi:hypothetical protein
VAGEAAVEGNVLVGSPTTPRLAQPPDLYEKFAFTATVRTDLSLLFMGDSVAIQLSQAFEEALSVGDATHLAAHRKVLRHSIKVNDKRLYEGLTVYKPPNSSGIMAAWRITAMLNRTRENRPLPNLSGGGWVRADVDQLLNETKSRSFDSMIFRIPQGWITLADVNEESLTETVTTAHKLFGVSSVIFVSLPFVNNYVHVDDVLQLYAVNDMLREYCNKYTRNDVDGV